MTAQRPWAMVTGASGGIGRAIAERLAQDGWNLLVHYHRADKAANETCEILRRFGATAHEMSADLGNSADCEQLVARAWEITGGVDAWIHAAGADVLTGDNAALDFEQKFHLLQNVDVLGTIRCCREVGGRMRDRGHGAIVTVGWDQAEYGMEGDSGQLFAAVKGAVMAFSRSLAKTLAPSVRVNCLAPGWVRTAWGQQASDYWQQRVIEETPLARWGTPEDCAAVAAFLVAPTASFLTGQTINVNGGCVTS